MTWAHGIVRHPATIVARGVALVAWAFFAASLTCAPPAAALSEGAQECAACHNSENTGTVVVEGERRSLAVDVAAYEVSPHGQLDCTACHHGFEAGPHTAAQTEGWLRTARVDACANCHADQSTMYEGSFHGTLALGEEDGAAPFCADCHVPHDIMPPDTLAFRRSSLDLCAGCHGGRSDSYLDSYHGKAFLLGKDDAATCIDCHGGHRILPASDPESPIADGNRVEMCAECHPEANANFAGFLVHVDPKDPTDSFWVFIFWLAYVLLIAAVFTFGGIHTVMYIYRGIKDGLYGRKRH